MTGHGDAVGQNERLNVSIEVRSVNNRHLKVSVRCPDAFMALEGNVERVVREVIARGTLNVHLHVKRLDQVSAFQINTEVARTYFQQLVGLSDALGAALTPDFRSLLSLPGVVDDGKSRTVEENDWPLIESVLREALAKLQVFRADEGAAMQAELLQLADVIETEAGFIAERAPGVVADYRERTKARLNEILTGNGIKVEDKDLIREMGVYADRCDITEELTRLRSHLRQYRSLLNTDVSNGRKLEFLGQEVFREVNTTGSKANDVEIAHRVVEMKAAVEKMREIILNVE